MTISIFNRRTMIEALEEMKAPQTFFVKKFFGTQKTFDTAVVDVDIRKGTRRTGVYVRRRAEGNVVDREGYKTYTYEPPYLKPKMVTVAEDLLTRMPGEILYDNNMSPAQRAAAQLGEDMQTLEDIIARAEELQAMQALFDGVVQVLDIDGEEVLDDIDFQRDADHTIDLNDTGEVPWDNSGATIVKDIKAWKILNVKDSGISSNIGIMGTDAAQAFLDDSEVRELLDNRRIDLGALELEAQELGVEYIGSFLGIAWYQVDEWYIDPATGTETALVPTNKVMIGSTNARCERLYGAIADAENGPAAVPRYPKSWVTEDPSARWIQLHSAPLCAPIQVDAFTVATVLTA